jgi:hypothetical protein
MNGKTNKLIGFVICCLISLSAFAYKFVPFSDLDSLMGRSDLIVLAKIAHPTQDEDNPRLSIEDGLVELEVIVFHNIKGSLSLDRHHVILQRDFIRKYHNFRLNGDSAILFLTTQSSIGGKKVLMNWSNSGSIMPASPDLDLDKLKGLSEKDKIVFILKDYVAFKKKQLEELQADISKIIVHKS